MSQISEVTGLPELPAGMWWEVRKHMNTTYRSFSGYIEEEDGYQVCIVTKKTLPGSITPGKHWWSFSIVTPETFKSEVLFSAQITDPKLYAEWVKSCLSDSWRSDRIVGKKHIEPADVLKVARDLIDIKRTSDESEARKVESDALLGIYPPKKLEAAK